MQVWGITHKGAVRQQNQDTFSAQTLEDGRILALVCDGMGGARAGNVASVMAVELFAEGFHSAMAQGHSPETAMQEGAARANNEIFHRSIHDENCQGMGTTLVAALVDADGAIILNEGDSRAYHIGQQGITLITRDHSLVEDMVERGELTRDEARIHPHKNLITHALGADPVLRTDTFHQPMLEGEYLLLCSDGLSNLLTEQELRYEVIHGGQPQTCCQRLLDMALEREAPDNVTVVLVQF